MTPYVYQTLFYLFSITLFAILSEALWLTTVEIKNIVLSAVMAICTATMLYVTVIRLPYPFIEYYFIFFEKYKFNFMTKFLRYIKIWDNCIRAAMYASLCWFAVSINIIIIITKSESIIFFFFEIYLYM